MQIRRLISQKRFKEAKEELQKIVPPLGAHQGQTNRFKDSEFYVKAGKVHRYDPEKDAQIKSQHIRSPSSPPWRGDLKGKMV
jgi:transcription antitermination factor NusG